MSDIFPAFCLLGNIPNPLTGCFASWADADKLHGSAFLPDQIWNRSAWLPITFCTTSLPVLPEILTDRECTSAWNAQHKPCPSEAVECDLRHLCRNCSENSAGLPDRAS